jgi:hypothetical protein
MLWLELDPAGQLQSDEQLMPRNWLNIEGFEEKVLEMRNWSSEYFDTLDHLHFDQVYYCVHGAILEVVKEQQFVNGHYVDEIDTIIHKQIQERDSVKCLNCGKTISKRKIKCDCGHTLQASKEKQAQQSASKYQISKESKPPSFKEFTFDTNTVETKVSVERYNHIDSHMPDHPIKLKLSDPAFVNPNSYKNVSLVLNKIGKECGIHRYGGDKRNWTIVCCDGLPYNLLMRIIQDTRTCSICNKPFMGDELSKHFKATHPGQKLTFFMEYDWVVLKIGGGHYEMNMTKSFFELNWIPFMSELCYLMGFKSDPAQAAAKKCSDNHKSWKLLLIFHSGTMRELVLPYVRECLCNDIEPTAGGFLNDFFKKEMINAPTYQYMGEQVMTYVQAIINFRMGIRRNNSLLVQSAKFKGASLFHGRNHSTYQKIELYDTLMRIQMPTNLKRFMEKYESISQSGNPSLGEDWDFILEGINKDGKQLLPRGVPSAHKWLVVTRNWEAMQEMKTSTRDMMGLLNENDSQTPYRMININAGMCAWRARLRSSGQLSKDNNKLKSIKGEELDENLGKFTTLAVKRRAALIDSLYLGKDQQENDLQIIHPVYVTASERAFFNNIAQQSKGYVFATVDEMIENVKDADLQQQLQQRIRDITTKRDMLSIYAEVKIILQEQNNDVTDDITD